MNLIQKVKNFDKYSLDDDLWSLADTAPQKYIETILPNTVISLQTKTYCIHNGNNTHTKMRWNTHNGIVKCAQMLAHCHQFLYVRFTFVISFHRKSISFVAAASKSKYVSTRYMFFFSFSSCMFLSLILNILLLYVSFFYFMIVLSNRK